jgi:hypothetical protein
MTLNYSISSQGKDKKDKDKANVMVVVKMIYLELIQILAIVEGANLMKKRKKKVKTKFQNSLIQNYLGT